ncbi:MAG: TetR family transcriptional regulator [Acidobacteriota bacterium]|nr:TetR family transcriptional regulator [Acidobacteriota bacterium]
MTSSKTPRQRQATLPSRERLICSAEQLFAERGFNGVSVRDITNAAKVNSALLGYYFGSKEGLLAEVYTRHCEPLKQERLRLLHEFRARDGKLTLEDVLEAFLRPSLAASHQAHDGRSFSRLRAILSVENSSLLEKLVAQNFDEASSHFVDELSQCLPHLSREDVLWRFHFLLGTIYYTATGPHRIRTLSEGRCDPSDPEATTAELVPFLAAGFRAPATRPAAAAAPRRRSAATRRP